MISLNAVKACVVRTAEWLWPPAWTYFCLWTKNHNFEPELWLAPELIKADSIAIDVGANNGVWSLQLARFARMVHAFEPNPICLAELARRLPRNVIVHPFALSDQEAKMELRFDPSNTGIGTIEPANRLKNNSGIRKIETTYVVTRSLDSFEFANVGIIKIDVEGHEESVLNGARVTLARCRPVIVMEIEERHNAGGLARVRSFFGKMDYACAAIDSGRLRDIRDIELEGRRKIGSADGINNFIFMDCAAACWMRPGLADAKDD